MMNGGPMESEVMVSIANQSRNASILDLRMHIHVVRFIMAAIGSREHIPRVWSAQA